MVLPPRFVGHNPGRDGYKVRSFVALMALTAAFATSSEQVHWHNKLPLVHLGAATVFMVQ